MSCRTCLFTYVGESKRCWKSRGAEHKPGTNGNIVSAEKQHAETTGHDIHPNNVNILETGEKAKNKRVFLESLQSFLDKNSVNERAPFPRVYASLVSSLILMLRLVVVLFQFVFSSNHSHSHKATSPAKS